MQINGQKIGDQIKKSIMKDNIDNIGDYLGQCMNMFFWDYVSYKNTPSVRATKIFKNNRSLIKTI